MSKFNLSIDQGIFYITNVCNLTCNGCESYNNRKFKGHFYWKDYENDYTEWARKLDINFITIIGGEPFSNPDLINWVLGLRKLWPQCKNFNICTNGTYIKNYKSIIDLCIKNNIWLDISCHDPALFDKLKTDLEIVFGHDDLNLEFVGSKIDFYKKNQFVATLYQAYNFQKSSQKFIKDGITYMHTSNIENSHSMCVSKLGHCHTFVRGNLYQCYLTGISSDLISQFKIEDRARDLLSSYKPCSPWDSENNIKKFLEEAKKPIAQCTLCPERITIFPIWPLKIKKDNL